LTALRGVDAGEADLVLGLRCVQHVHGIAVHDADHATGEDVGPENGTLDETVTGWCRDRVYVPTRRCLNLAGAVNIVLYDRLVKRGRAALWEDHVFEPLLRWVNGLPPDGWICLRGGADLGATATFLKSDPGEIERFEKRFPLVVGNRPMAQILEGDRPVVCGKTVDTTRRDTVCRTSAPYCLKDVRGTPNATRHH
jgi:hypothetical protein